MAAESTVYSKLPGRASGLISTYTLHMADDHLLYVEQPWFYQTYTRFYFRDIQSIVLTDSFAFAGLNIFFGGFVTLAIILTLLFADSNLGVSIFFGVVSATFLSMFIINLVRGPTCKLAIQTRVNRKIIASLGRKRTAYKVLPRIEEKIRAFQDVRDQEKIIDVLRPPVVDPIRMNDAAPPGRTLPAVEVPAAEAPSDDPLPPAPPVDETEPPDRDVF